MRSHEGRRSAEKCFCSRHSHICTLKCIGAHCDCSHYGSIACTFHVAHSLILAEGGHMCMEWKVGIRPEVVDPPLTHISVKGAEHRCSGFVKNKRTNQVFICVLAVWRLRRCSSCETVMLLGHHGHLWLFQASHIRVDQHCTVLASIKIGVLINLSPGHCPLSDSVSDASRSTSLMAAASPGTG